MVEVHALPGMVMPQLLLLLLLMMCSCLVATCSVAYTHSSAPELKRWGCDNDGECGVLVEVHALPGMVMLHL